MDEKKVNRFYLCDGMACNEQCALKKTLEEWAEYECHHTSDESHARNKCRRDRRWYISNGMMIEKNLLQL